MFVSSLPSTLASLRQCFELHRCHLWLQICSHRSLETAKITSICLAYSYGLPSFSSSGSCQKHTGSDGTWSGRNGQITHNFFNATQSFMDRTNLSAFVNFSDWRVLGYSAIAWKGIFNHSCHQLLKLSRFLYVPFEAGSSKSTAHPISVMPRDDGLFSTPLLITLSTRFVFLLIIALVFSWSYLS